MFFRNNIDMSDNMHPNAVFISDTHLSTLKCKTDNLIYTITTFTCPDLYILGDFVDLWKLRTMDYWPNDHTDVLYEVITRLLGNTNIHYIIGNHDDFFEELTGQLQNFEICRKSTITIAGKKFLLMHGHKFDFAVRFFKHLAILGTASADVLSYVGSKLSRIKAKLGLSRFSLSDFLSKGDESQLEKFERSALRYAKRKGFDGIICGHTHRPSLKVVENMVYANTGDFVENSTFIKQDDNILRLMKVYDGKATPITTLDLSQI